MSSPENDGRTRVAILGGGCGAMATAFWLTATEDLRSRYAVSVYTHGWRLGGKGANGRQHDESDRILEHGLHMWMGFYETAFRSIRTCYDEWHKSSDYPFQTWTDAFTPLRQLTLEQRVPDDDAGPWQSWTFELPQLPGTPGDPDDELLHNFVRRLLAWLRAHLHTGLSIPPALEVADGRAALEAAHSAAETMAEASGAALEEVYREICRLLVDAQHWFQHWAEPLLRALDKGFEICALADVALALGIGYLRDVLPWGEVGFARIDHLDFRDWLRSHGAKPEYVWTAPVRCLYDLGFAYRGGDSSSAANAQAAAGVALRILLSAVAGYRDAPLWKMNAGMGDTIFTPLYEVLRARGVAFHFFHRVQNIGVSADGGRVERIDLSRQVDVADEPYDPLATVRKLRCWPSEPRWELIRGGKPADDAAWDLESAWCLYEVGRRTLTRGVDFDLVVLAIPPAALPDIGAELLAQSKLMRRMHERMSWVATRSAQIWLEPDLAGLGWTAGPTVATAYANPFRSWGEMSHLIVRETWQTTVPRSCEYFCGTLVPPATLPPYGDRRFLRDETARVKRDFLAWADDSIGHLFPNATGPDGQGFNQALVVSQFYRVNLDPSEMYVQSFPGSIDARLDAAGSGLANLYLAGDWTRTRLNSGCVEAAIESGKNAAEAICGQRIDLPLPPPAPARR
jgi:uncharacterized protein with NAD-binding domain and iron-sulfur cluster